MDPRFRGGDEVCDFGSLGLVEAHDHSDETPHPSGEGWRKRPRRTPSPHGRGLHTEFEPTPPTGRLPPVPPCDNSDTPGGAARAAAGFS